MHREKKHGADDAPFVLTLAEFFRIVLDFEQPAAIEESRWFKRQRSRTSPSGRQSRASRY